MEENKIITLDEHLENDRLSRRNMLIKGGKLSAGLAGIGLLSSLNIACGKDDDETVAAAAPVYTTTPGTGSDGVTLFKYSTVNNANLGQESYDYWFTNYCAYATAAPIIDALKASLGGEWDTFPIMAFQWAHGGGVGWGTICGTLTGAAYLIGMVAGKDPGEAMINDLMYYYSDTAFPIFEPTTQNAGGTASSVTTISGTPICHASTSKWMLSASVAFFTAERKDRCARLSADICLKVVAMLNEWAATGTYTAVNNSVLGPTTSTALHNTATSRPSQVKSSCNSCHDTTDAFML